MNYSYYRLSLAEAELRIGPARNHLAQAITKIIRILIRNSH